MTLKLHRWNATTVRKKIEKISNDPERIMQGIKSDNNDKNHLTMPVYYSAFKNGVKSRKFHNFQSSSIANKKFPQNNSIHPQNNIKN